MRKLSPGSLRVAACTIPAIVVLFPILLALFGAVPNELDTPLASPQRGWSHHLLPLYETGGPHPPQYVLWLRANDLGRLLSVPEVRLPFGTDGHRVVVIRGELRVLGTDCALVVQPGSEIADHKPVNFERTSGCERIGNSAGDLKLQLTINERRPLALRTYRLPDAGRDPSWVEAVGLPDRKGPFPVVQGRLVTYAGPSGLNRADLLAYVWNVRQGRNWLVLSVLLAALFITLGQLLAPADARVSPFRSRYALRGACGAALLAFGYAALYAVIVPPLHAPDEPSHFLGYQTFAGHPQAGNRLTRWAQKNHFKRIQFQRLERFRPADIETWSNEPLDAMIPDALERGSRGALAAAAAPLMRPLPMPRAFLGLRLAGAALFAIAVGLGVFAVAQLTDVPYPHLVMFPIFAVPALPFFAMHVSNYAALTSAYVFFACVAFTVIHAGRLGHMSGALLGLSTGFVVTTSRSAVPMLWMSAALLVGRIICNAKPGTSRRETLVFWIGFAIALVAAMATADTKYWQFLAHYAGLSEHVRAAMVGSALFLLIGVAFGVFVERHAVSRRAMSPRHAPLRTRIVGITGAAAVVLLMVLPMILDLPRLAPIDPANRPTVFGYVGQVAASAIGLLRLQGPDHLLWSSFLAGFGWLESIPPNWYIGLLTFLIGLGLASVLLYAGWMGNRPLLAWVALIGLGFVLTLLTYAAAAARYSPDLHGRYLIGLYLTALITWLSLPALLPPAKGPLPRVPVLMTIIAAIHAYALTFLLHRFF